MTEQVEIEVTEEDSPVQVMPPEPDNNLKVVRAKIRESLEKIDPAQARVWDELNSITDTNQYIALNLQQAQMHLQKLQEDIYSRQKRMEEELDKIMNDGLPDREERYWIVKTGQSKELESLTAHSLKIMAMITSMAKEHRQSLMQKKFMIHIIQVQQWKMMVEASIHRHIHDKETLGQIGVEISEAGRAMFPVGANEDF